MSEIRSVSVRLDADVAGYIAKMKLAGAATDQAFSGADSKLATVNRGLQGVETTAGKTESAVRRLDNTVNRSGSGWTKYATKVNDFLGKIGVLPALAIAATAALQPLAVSAAAVAAGFAAPIAFVGGGLTLFALLGGAAIKETNKQLKSIDQLQKKLGGLTKGTKEYAQTQKDLANAQRALSGPQKAYSDGLDHIKRSFDKFITGKSGDELLGPITAALNLGANVLPKLEPIIAGVSGGLETLLTDLQHFSNTKDFENFVKQVGRRIGPDLVAGGRALGSFTHGVGDLLLTLDKRLSPEMLHGLGHLGDIFQSWAGSKRGRDDVQAFIDYFHQVGPQTGRTIGDIADALGQISRALAPLSPVTLRVISGIATAIASIPVPVLTALAGATIGLSAINKSGLGKVLSKGFGGTSGGSGGPVGAILNRVQPVEVMNWPPGLLVPGGGPGGRGAPVPVGGPGGGGGGKLGISEWINRVLFAPAAIAAVATASQGILHKEYGDTVGTIFGQVQRGILHIPYMPPDAAVRQAKVWDQVFTGHFKNALDILKAPGPSDFNIKKPDFSGAKHALGSFFSLPDQAPKVAPVKAVATAYDGLAAKVAKASRQIDQIGPRSNASVGSAVRVVTGLGGRLNAINGHHAEQAMEVVGHSAAANFQAAGGQVDGFKGKLNSIPGKKVVQVEADTGSSLARLRDLSATLAAIRSKTITVTTNTVAGGHVKMGNAEGGTISGQRYPYGDKVLSWLAPGEEIISNRHGEADRFRADRAMGRIPHYASGGTSGSSSTSSSSSTVTPGERHEINSFKGHLHSLSKALEEATKTLDKERQARQNLIQQRQSVVGTVQDSFRSDLFGQTNPWGDATSPLSILQGDIRNARQYRSIISRLRRRGLSGGLASQVTTLADAQEISRYSRAQIRQLEHLYNVRQQVSHAAGAIIGNAAFGDQIAAQTKVIQAQAADVRHLKALSHEANKRLAAIEKAAKANPKDVGNQINGAARNARRRVRP